MQIVEKQRCSECGQHQDALIRFERGGPYCYGCLGSGREILSSHGFTSGGWEVLPVWELNQQQRNAPQHRPVVCKCDACMAARGPLNLDLINPRDPAFFTDQTRHYNAECWCNDCCDERGEQRRTGMLGAPVQHVEPPMMGWQK